jgi:hypothetical protein
MILMGNINIDSPSVYAYADKGVMVHASAVCTSVSIYSPEGTVPSAEEGLGPLVQRYGSSIINTTKCVPVFLSASRRSF